MYTNIINRKSKPFLFSHSKYVNSYFRFLILTTYFLFYTFSSVYSQNETSTLLDIRDGKVYKTVKIGNQWWMAENLNIGTKVKGVEYGVFQKNNGIIEKYFYKDDDKNGEVYGGLYDWDEAMNYAEPSDKVPSGVQGICPCGWHIPSDEEWNILERYLGMPELEIAKEHARGTDEADKLKEVGNSHWLDDTEDTPGVTIKNKGNNETGFTALPAGNRHNYALIWGNQGVSTAFWSSSASFDNSLQVYAPVDRYISGKYSTIGKSAEAILEFGKSSYSVRCVKDPEKASVKEDKAKFRIYPNPASEYLVIENASASQYFTIYNIQGEKVFEIDNQNRNNTIRIDISKFDKSIYYISGTDINLSFVKY